jgi:hypothetical protein
MTELLVVLAIVIVALASIIFLVLNFNKKINFSESLAVQGELRKQRQEFFLSHRMEAYQRAILYMERIHPVTIVMRMNQQQMNAVLFQSMLLKAIRDEYDHNVAQQMFISPNAWHVLKNAKEETVKLINVGASELPADASSSDLAKAIITLTADINPLPSEIAIDALKAEFQQLL